MASDPITPQQADSAILDDEKQLADLGYKQELSRAWSGFTNFAISFTIISVLAGPLTNFSFAWNAGGPAGIACAVEAARAGLRPTLIDESPRLPAGGLRRQPCEPRGGHTGWMIHGGASLV